MIKIYWQKGTWRGQRDGSVVKVLVSKSDQVQSPGLPWWQEKK